MLEFFAGTLVGGFANVVLNSYIWSQRIPNV